MSDSKQSDQYKGWLYKWTNYIKGYQKRWFVLQNGLLSYYRLPFYLFLCLSYLSQQCESDILGSRSIEPSLTDPSGLELL